jgi:hypothetical protein
MDGSAVARSRVPLRVLLCVLLVAALVAALVQWLPNALAEDRAKTPVAPPGAGPVSRALPVSAAEPNHGYPAGQRPPVVPLETPAAGPPRRLSTQQWAAVPKPGTRRPADAPPPSPGGAQNLLLRPGFTLDDTSLVVYFDTIDPGISAYTFSLPS